MCWPMTPENTTTTLPCCILRLKGIKGIIDTSKHICLLVIDKKSTKSIKPCHIWYRDGIYIYDVQMQVDKQ